MTTKRRTKKLTPKQRVLKKYPHAHAMNFRGTVGWVVYEKNANPAISDCRKTEAAAWADAAQHSAESRASLSTPVPLTGGKKP